METGQERANSWIRSAMATRRAIHSSHRPQAVCVAISYLSLHLCNRDLLLMIMRGWKYRGGGGGGVALGYSRPRYQTISIDGRVYTVALVYLSIMRIILRCDPSSQYHLRRENVPLSLLPFFSFFPFLFTKTSIYQPLSYAKASFL